MYTIIGLDGGGTKTAGCIGHSKNDMIAYAKSGGINQYAFKDDEIIKNLKNVINQLLQKSNKTEDVVDLIVISTAGVDSERDKKRFESIYEKCGYNIPILLNNDSESFMKGNFNNDPAICLISGTGSIAFGQGSNKSYRFGGHGHLIGDEGSGYDIAIKGLKRAFFDFDQGIVSPLMESFMAYTECSDPMEVRRWVYSGLPKKDIASLSICVYQLANEGVEEARMILIEAADDLVYLVMNLYHKMKADGVTPKRFGFNGSILVNIEAMKEIVLSEVGRRTEMEILKKPYTSEVCALIQGYKHLKSL